VAFYENLTLFKGQPVVDWSPETAGLKFSENALRLRLDYSEADKGVSMVQKLAGLLAADGIEQLQSLVIGSWQPDDSSTDSGAIVAAIVAARSRLRGLRNLFLGDIISEECEISWIRQTNLSSLLATYDLLEHLTVRGSDNLSFGTPSHDRLKELIIQSGGLPPAVIHEIESAHFPSLEHLELYLGEPNYGGDATVEDLLPLLRANKRFPKLRYLGLKDSVIADDIAAAVAQAPLVPQLEVLDLSLGTLGDDGARALLASSALRALHKLDLHYHFISDPLVAQLQGIGIEVDVSDRQEPDEWGGEQHRYIAVSE
jgi:hypothetical protein